MTQTTGTFPALSDGVGVGKKKPRKKTITVGPKVKAQLDRLHQRIQRRKAQR